MNHWWGKKNKNKDTANNKDIATSNNPFENTDKIPGGSIPNYSAPKKVNSYTRQDSTDRRELFSGYDTDRYNTRRPTRPNTQSDFNASNNTEEADKEVVQIKNKIRNTKQDTLQATRNAVQKITEAENSAANTMSMLSTQSTQIANVNRRLDDSKVYSDRAASQTNELKKINRSIFIPVINNPFRKKHTNVAEEQEPPFKEHAEEKNEIRKFEYNSSVRMEEASRTQERDSPSIREGRSQKDRQRYQFEADSEDDAVEDEIENNLDILSGAISGLKHAANAMNEELIDQNKQLGRTTEKVDPLTRKLASTTSKLNKIK